MSRVGKKTIAIPKGVTINVNNGQLSVKGPKGELSRKMPPLVDIVVEANEAQVKRKNDHRRSRSMHGLCRALLQNMVTGVSQGFTRVLDFTGVGYRADAKGGMLTLALGYSHPIEVLLPTGVAAKVEKDKNRIELSGIDNEVLGQVAAVIRGQRPPEPYKGKGLKYEAEHILRKEGKTSGK